VPRNATGQPGTPAANDPLIDYAFTAAGTYKIRVAANVVWDSFTSGSAGIFGYVYSVPNTFRTSGVQELPTGMNYQLYISLQGHTPNPNQFTFVGDTVTITGGTGAGQSATISGYDPESHLFTLLNNGFGIAGTNGIVIPDVTSQFEITKNMSLDPAYQNQAARYPNSDTYQVVLTSPLTGAQQVTIDVSPQATPTYNSADAFNPDTNFGSNNFVQVNVSTSQARFALQGTPATGETWTIWVDSTPFSHAVVTTLGVPESLASVANALGVLLSNAGYQVTILGGTTIIVRSAHSSFRAGFSISGDTSGNATVTGTGLTTTVALNGTPGLNEVWTLTVDGTAYSTIAQAGDHTSDIATRLAGLLPSGLYGLPNVTGSTITLTRQDGKPVAASLSVSTAAGAPATVGSSSVAVELGGIPSMNETWSCAPSESRSET